MQSLYEGNTGAGTRISRNAPHRNARPLTEVSSGPLPMRVETRTSAKRRRRTPDQEGSGKDLGNFTGFAHSRISAHIHAARTGYSTARYDPIAAFLPSKLLVWIPKVAR